MTYGILPLMHTVCEEHPVYDSEVDQMDAFHRLMAWVFLRWQATDAKLESHWEEARRRSQRA